MSNVDQREIQSQSVLARACDPPRGESLCSEEQAERVNEMKALKDAQLSTAMLASQRRRLMKGEFESGEDVSALRRFVGLSQSRFAEALGISVHTLRNWEQNRRRPEGPALALLRIAARHPRIIRENVVRAA